MDLPSIYAGLNILSYVREKLPPFDDMKDKADSIRGKTLPETIDGCILEDSVHWRVSAEREEDTVAHFEVDPSPYCPDCKTELNRTTGALPGASQIQAVRNRPFWKCIECGDMESRDRGVHSEVERKARKHVEKIVETRGAEFSLDVLAEEFREQNDGDTPSGKDIWRLYVGHRDEDYLTSDCFYS